MAFIQTVPEKQAQGNLADLYKRFGNPDGTVDNVLKVHSLNPDSMQAHCALYTQSMHKPSPVSRAEREMVGVTVSRLNGCTYCQNHHSQGLKQLLPEDRKSIVESFMQGDEQHLTDRERAMTAYATKLTIKPDSISQSDINTLRDAGLTDREVLDIAQAAAYFAYANRIVLGLGAELEEEIILGQWPASS